MITPTNEELMTQLGVTAQQAAELVQYFEGVRADIGDNMGIEYGTNANGEYMKFPGGGLICIKEQGSDTYCNITNGSNFVTGNNDWNYPYIFINRPRVSGFIGLTMPNSWLVGGSDVALGDYMQWRAMSSTAQNSVYPVATMLAIGRWKNV